MQILENVIIHGEELIDWYAAPEDAGGEPVSTLRIAWISNKKKDAHICMPMAINARQGATGEAQVKTRPLWSLVLLTHAKPPDPHRAPSLVICERHHEEGERKSKEAERFGGLAEETMSGW